MVCCLILAAANALLAEPSGPVGPAPVRKPPPEFTLTFRPPSNESPPPRGWRLSGSLHGRSVDLLEPRRIWNDDDRLGAEAGLVWRGDQSSIVIGYRRWVMAPPAPVTVDLGFSPPTGGHPGIVGLSFRLKLH